MSEPPETTQPAQLPRFFFSYRRQDASAETGRLRDALAEALLERYPNASSQDVDAAIFLDVVGITAGRDFESTIEHTLSKVTVVIAVVGPLWHGPASWWTARIRRNTDWVRRELEAAHALPVAILPVRVDAAPPLRERDLPASLRYLVRLQTPELRNERWEDDVTAFMRDVIRASEQVRETPDAFRGTASAPSIDSEAWWRLPRNIALVTAWLGLFAGVFVQSDFAATGLMSCNGAKTATSIEAATSRAAAGSRRPAPAGEFVQRPHASGALAALAPNRDSIGVFWVAPDRAVKNRYWDLSMGYAWTEQSPTFVTLPKAAAADSTVSVVARTQDDLHAFWIAPDRTIRANRWYRNDKLNWRADNHNLGSAADGSNVTALARESNQLDVFWVGREHDIWTGWWDDVTKQWGARSITHHGLAAEGASVSAVARKRELLEVFWVDQDGLIRGKRWTGQQNWIVGESLQVTPPEAAMGRSAITVLSRNPDQLDLFWITANGSVNTLAWSETDEKQSWLDHPIVSITRDGSARPGAQVAAVARAGERLDIFWIDTTGAIQTQWSSRIENGDWDQHKTSQVLPPGSAAATSSLSAVARTDENLALFWIDNDRALRTLSLEAAAGQPWIQRGSTTVIQADDCAALPDTDLDGVDLTRTNLASADFGHAYLHGAKLDAAWLCQSIFTHANLEGAGLKGSHYDEHTSFPDGFTASEAGAVDDPVCAEARFVSGCERAHGVGAPR